MRPNVPEADAKVARQAIAGYYAHIAALDDCIGDLVKTIHHDNGTGFSADTHLQHFKIDPPTVVFIIFQRIENRFYRFQCAQHLEKRVTGGGNQDLVPWIGKQFEQIGVGLAGAGSEEN